MWAPSQRDAACSHRQLRPLWLCSPFPVSSCAHGLHHISLPSMSSGTSSIAGPSSVRILHSDRTAEVPCMAAQICSKSSMNLRTQKGLVSFCRICHLDCTRAYLQTQNVASFEEASVIRPCASLSGAAAVRCVHFGISGWLDTIDRLPLWQGVARVAVPCCRAEMLVRLYAKLCKACQGVYAPRCTVCGCSLLPPTPVMQTLGVTAGTCTALDRHTHKRSFC